MATRVTSVWKASVDQVVDGAEIVARLRLGNIAIGAFAVGGCDLGQWRIEPRIGPARANLRLANGREVLIHAAFVGRPICFSSRRTSARLSSRTLALRRKARRWAAIPPLGSSNSDAKISLQRRIAGS